MRNEIQNIFIQGRWQDNRPNNNVSLIIADPLYNPECIRDIAEEALTKGIPAIIFMMPEDVWDLPAKPDKVIHWIKPESPKKTTKQYSRFIECMACYGIEFHRFIHWSNRTGLFYDRIVCNSGVPWKKPESLIERLLINHYAGDGIVYDPFAGSRTVETACKRYAIPSLSISI